MARAISLKAELAFEKYNNYPEAEKLSREAISSYKKTANKKGLYKTNLLLGMTLHSQSIFEAAINNYDTAYALSNKPAIHCICFLCCCYFSTCQRVRLAIMKRHSKSVGVLHQLVLGTAMRNGKAGNHR